MFRHYKGGRSSPKCTGHLYPRINPWYSLSEAESTSGHMVLSGVPRKKSPLTPPGINPGTIRLVVQRLIHYVTPGPPSSVSTDAERPGYCRSGVCIAQEVDGVWEKGVRRYYTVQNISIFAGFFGWLWVLGTVFLNCWSIRIFGLKASRLKQSCNWLTCAIQFTTLCHTEQAAILTGFYGLQNYLFVLELNIAKYICFQNLWHLTSICIHERN